jgi:hypothetical protein
VSKYESKDVIRPVLQAKKRLSAVIRAVLQAIRQAKKQLSAVIRAVFQANMLLGRCSRQRSRASLYLDGAAEETFCADWIRRHIGRHLGRAPRRLLCHVHWLCPLRVDHFADYPQAALYNSLCLALSLALSLSLSLSLPLPLPLSRSRSRSRSRSPSLARSRLLSRLTLTTKLMTKPMPLAQLMTKPMPLANPPYYLSYTH